MLSLVDAACLSFARPPATRRIVGSMGRVPRVPMLHRDPPVPGTIVHADSLAGKLPVAPRAQTLGVVEFEALVGADTVRGVTNSPPYTYTFSTAFGSAPTVAVTTMAGVDGGRRTANRKTRRKLFLTCG